MDNINLIGQFCDKLQEQVNMVKKENERLKGTLAQINTVCVQELDNAVAVDKILEILSQAEDLIVKGENYEDTLPF